MTFMFKFKFRTEPEPPPPEISSIGPPPDRHAERIVDEMLVWLHGHQGDIWERCRGSLRRSQMGNPVGQQRAVARLKRALGDMALEVGLVTGKRGKYYLTLSQWMVWDSGRNTLAEPNREPPTSPWIAIAISFQGVDTKHEWRNSIPMLVTRHAMVRLAQRAGVRTVADLILAMRDLWGVLYDLVMATDTEEWLTPPPAGWRLRMEGGAIAVIGRQDEKPRRLIVKTILDPGAEQ